MFPFFRLTFIWISGIIAACCYPIALWITLLLSFIGLLLYLSIVWIATKAAFLSIWSNSIGLWLMFMLSYSHTIGYITERQQNSLSKWLSNDQPCIAYQVTVQKVYPQATSSCLASVTHIKIRNDWYRMNDLIQLYCSKKYGYKPTEGDTLLILGKPIPLVRNAAAKCYERFIYPQATYRQRLQGTKRCFILIEQQQNKKWKEILQDCYRRLLQKEVKEAEAIAFIETLLFGTKESLPPVLRKAYADTGTMHVLAVSGLHVGMLHWFISKPLTYLLYNGKMLNLFNVFILIMLWLYAWLCNFAPAMVRATIMLTLARLSLGMGRSLSSGNGLAIAAFITLVWKPFLLFNWGFQFSYMATLGMLYLQRPIQNSIRINNYWLQKIWASTALSIAAQLSTLPLILYYFKQFPLYFILANWIVVPAMFGILMLSLLGIVVSYLPILPSLLGFILAKLIFITNSFVTYIARWPLATIDGFMLNGYSACLLYIVLFATYFFFKYKRLIYPLIVSVCIAFFSFNRIRKIIKEQNSCQLICRNNQTLAFTLRDKCESVNGSDWQGADHLPYSCHYGGNRLAVWYGKVIWAIRSIPPDWYHWHHDKMRGHYLLIEPKLLEELDTLAKVCTFQTVVVYSKQKTKLNYLIRSKIKQLGIELIWLQPDSEKVFTWSTNS
ncbi:MAG: ComEC/Rec2 family competence protein [Candidatus Cardinium sp.]|nr:ComEC/Rec2 family competence protein [Candidatus Cardinium sp.]